MNMQLLNFTNTKEGKIQTKSNAENGIKKMINHLVELPGITKVKYLDSQISSVSTKWGVAWNEFQICRDYIQNFYDQNRENVNAIDINIKNDLISITAPKEFDLRELYFLGSQKAGDDSTVGSFGEGFKAATVSLIKLGHEYVTSTSGKIACVISIADTVDSGLDIRPLVYNFFEINPQNGCGLFIKSFNEELKSAFKVGLNQYWYEDNNLVGDLIHKHNDFSFYKSNDEHGHIFYGSIKRASIKNIPLVINIGKKYAQVEKKVKQDRDRNSFDDRITNLLYRIIFRSGLHYTSGASSPVVEYIFNKTKSLWRKGTGHPILQAMADNLPYINYYEEDISYLSELFGSKFYSQSNYRYSYSASWWEIQPDIAVKDRDFKKEKKIELPAYFTKFGVKSSAQLINEEHERIRVEAENKNTHNLTGKEIIGLKLCLEAIKEIAPQFRALFSDLLDGSYSTDDGRFYNVSFKSVTSEKLLGELKSSQVTYGDKVIYLNKKLFKEDFGEIFSTLLHEMGHLFGRDGDRQFTDLLTIVMCRIINNHKIINEYCNKWQAYQETKQNRSTVH